MIALTPRQIDKTTREWIVDPSDELAARRGCRFDPERAQFVIDWMEEYLRLYEGEFAGQPFTCRDWQGECFRRMFGWIRYDEDWSRILGMQTWIRRFNQAVIFIPKKNKKSPSLAALGLYLTCADGEMGGKSLFFARDGTQARQIAGKHAVEMLKQSPALMRECSINKSTFEIVHEPTRSILRPESGGDARSQESKEGINGNILVDEVHVVDRRLMNRVSRAGISRMEPWQIEVSTAGNDPDSYGKTRYEYARDVRDGTIDDQRLFVYIAEAPQDLTDADLAKDPVRYGKLANPAWGHTIRETEFLADWESSKKGGASEIAGFKMYRLNVWQRSANPLLDSEAWADMESEYGIQSLAGLGGGVGLDLSKTEDMSACVFACADPEQEDVTLVWPLFWMTRAYAEANNHLASFINWATAGDLKLVDSAAIKDTDILPDILDAIQIIKPTLMCYDPTYADALAIKIEEETEITLAKFPQTFAVYSNPTIEVRNAIRDKRIVHSGNRVMDWQVGHVIASERAGLIKPVKDDKQKHRKIDGVQALIMAHHAKENAPKEFVSVYEDVGPDERNSPFVEM